MNILVTGSEGFIGSHLVRALRANHNVFSMDKKSDRSTSNKELLFSVVQENQIDTIVHLGANCSSQISLRAPHTDFIDNVVGTFNVCEAARIFGCNIIFNSSMKVHRGEDGIISPYGASKQFGEDYLDMYHRIYGIDYVINRPSSVYGPGQNGSDDGGFVTWLIKASLSNQIVTLYGDGGQSRDILYIDDHIELLIDQIENFSHWKNDIYEFGGGPRNEVTLNQILDVLNYYKTQTAPYLPGDVYRFVCDNNKVREKGWSPRTLWTEGIKKTVEYFR